MDKFDVLFILTVIMVIYLLFELWEGYQKNKHLVDVTYFRYLARAFYGFIGVNFLFRLWYYFNDTTYTGYKRWYGHKRPLDEYETILLAITIAAILFDLVCYLYYKFRGNNEKN